MQSILSRLPDGPVPTLSVDLNFEEAALQCRKHCLAIHSHCQRHNTCYRDVDFEIDTDLLSLRRMCLDGLDSPIVDAESHEEPLDPKSVRRIRVSFQFHLPEFSPSPVSWLFRIFSKSPNSAQQKQEQVRPRFGERCAKV